MGRFSSLFCRIVIGGLRVKAKEEDPMSQRRTEDAVNVMDIKMNVFFTGLCAFVKHPSSNRARIVLVDASQEGDEFGGHPHDPHSATLLVPASHWVDADNKRKPDDYYSDPILGQTVYIFLLNKEDLVLPSSSTPFGLEKPLAVNGDGCPDSGDRSGLGWMLKVADCASSGDMRDEILKDPMPADVLARMAISAGSIGTAGFRFYDVGGGDRKILKWRFSHSIDPRAAAEEIFVSFVSSSSDDSLIIGSSRGSDYQFKLKSQNGKIQVAVANMPLIDIKYGRPPRPTDPDHHFIHFYRLGGVTGNIPSPVAGDYCPPAGIGLSNPKCPPAWFNDNANA